MTILDEFLQAEAAGRLHAVRRRALRHVHDGGDIRLLVPFHLAGNDFSVAGIAFGRPSGKPEALVCPPQPLDRIDVAERVTPFVDAFLRWVETHTSSEEHSSRGAVYYVADDCPQLLVPSEGSKTAVDNLAYFLRNIPQDWNNSERLRQVGWELSALVDASEWPGQCSLVPLTTAVAEHWALGLSSTESESLALSVALLEAPETGLSWPEIRAAEGIAVGPLGDPKTFDDVAYQRARAGARTPAPAVRTQVRTAWDVAVRAWKHLRAIPESPSAAIGHSKSVDDWARRIGGGRHHDRWTRRTVPPLGRSAARLHELEEAQSYLVTAQAASDPLVSAELASAGRAVLADVAHLVDERVGRAHVVRLEIGSSQLRVPGSGTAMFICGTPKTVVGVVTDVQGGPGAWKLTVTVMGGLKGHSGIASSGVRTARNLTDTDVRWLVPAAPGYVPRLRPPASSPATHPGSFILWNPSGRDPSDPDASDVLDDGNVGSGAGDDA